MATHTGSEGFVNVGANTVAEIRNFSLNVRHSTIEDTTINDSWRTRKPNKGEWSGSLSCFWDASDTDGQESLTQGGEVTLNFYFEGDASSAPYYTGSAIITAITRSSETDGMVTVDFEFEGNGALTQDTVTP